MRFSIGYVVRRRAVVALVALSVLAQPAAALADDDVTRLTNIELAEEAIRGAVREALNTLPAPQGDVRLYALGAGDVNGLVESILVEELAARGYPVEVATPAEASALGAAESEETDAAGGDDEEAAGDDADSSAAGDAAGPAGQRPPAGLAAYLRAAQDSMNAANGAVSADDAGEGAGATSQLGGRVASEADVTAGRSLFSYRVTDFSFRYADIFRKFFVGPRRIRRLAKVNLHLRLCEDGGRRVVWSENVAHSVSDVIPHGAAYLLESSAYAFAKPERTPGVFARIYEPLIVGGIVGGLVFLFYSNQSGE